MLSAHRLGFVVALALIVSGCGLTLDADPPQGSRDGDVAPRDGGRRDGANGRDGATGDGGTTRDGGTTGDGGTTRDGGTISDGGTIDADKPPCMTREDCDDGNQCTDDACLPTGCQNSVREEQPCDDGVFCNGPDSCNAAGMCESSGIDPCVVATTCSEARRGCDGCSGDEDCPEPIYGPLSTCVSSGSLCSTVGVQQQTITTFSCVAGSCVGGGATAMSGCSISTDGIVCGTSSCSACMFSDPCDTTGTQHCTEAVCSGGACGRVLMPTCTRPVPMACRCVTSSDCFLPGGFCDGFVCIGECTCLSSSVCGCTSDG